MELLSTLNDELSGLRRDVVCDLSAVLSVVHQEHLKLFWVVNKEFVKAVGQDISGGLVGTCSNFNKYRSHN